ncbi:stevor [Plasmodium reichenowi]|uniref:Stevor n=1 Tax=Plasmodium reichenowi TaxID=5854 RepID=A0A060RMB6_PLARE|nr:stevor [Plasmodium reichenowi]
MNTYYVKLLLFTFLINENYINNHYNIILIPKNTRRTIKSRLLAQTQIQNPHYHNDPELKGIIDKLNDEAIRKYQQTHDPYEQLKEVIEKNGTKLTGGNGAEPMSTTEKELFETYEEVFGKKNHIMLKSGMYPNDDDKSYKSSSCECTDINNTDLTKRKGKDKYLKNLKHRCIGGICSCSVGSFLLTVFGWHAAEAAAAYVVLDTCNKATISSSVFTITNILKPAVLRAALEASSASLSACAGDAAGTAAGAALAAFPPYVFAALALLILAVIIIILYIWLYKRRKNSWKHECKKHLCK